MTIELYDRLMAGGSNISWIFHVGGFPYALASDQAVIDALASANTTRQRLFGRANHGGVHPAWTLPIFNVLQSITPHTIQTTDETCELKKGDWSVQIARIEPGYSWTHRDGDIWGFEGIHTQPSPEYDNHIAVAPLYQNFTSGDIVVSADGDVGDRIQATIAALGVDEYLYLWIGTECIAVDGQNIVGAAMTLATRMRGVYRSTIQKYYVEPDSSPLLVANAPLHGAGNRPAYLWAIPMSDDGTGIAGEPVLWNQGRVSPRIETRNSLTKINIDPWWKWLDTRIPKSPQGGELAGYCFNRIDGEGFGTGQEFVFDRAPAILLWESDLTPQQTWDNPRRIYLLPQVASGVSRRYYPDRASMIEAMNEELKKCVISGVGNQTAINNSDGTHRLYTIDADGEMTHDGASGNVSMVDGYLPWILNLGYIQNDAIERVRHKMSRHRHWWTSNELIHEGLPTKNVLDTSGVDPTWAPPFARAVYSANYHKGSSIGFPRSACFIPSADERESMIARYAYQYRWIESSSGKYFGALERLWQWPVPKDQAANELLRLKIDGVSVSDFSGETMFAIGQPSERQMDGGIDSVGAGTSQATNWIRVDDTNAFHVTGTDLSAISAIDGAKGPMRHGSFLLYIPFFHEQNPWPVSGLCNLAPDDSDKYGLIKLFRGILGSTDVQDFTDFDSRRKVYHIPGAITDTAGNNDFASVIDWRDLDNILSGAGLSLNTRLFVGSDLNLLELITEELKLFGIAPKWYFSTTNKQWQMGFRYVAVCNKTEATWAGRTIDTSNREIYTAPRIEIHSGERVVNKLGVKLNATRAIGDDKEEFTTINITDQSGDVYAGRVDRGIKIKSRCSHLNGGDIGNVTQSDLFRNLMNRLQRLAMPQAEIKVDLSIQAAVSLGVGDSVVVTDSTIRNPFTGQLGLTAIAGIVSELKLDPGKGKVQAAIRVNLYPSYGWAPSLSMPAGTHAEIDATTLEVTLGAGQDNLFTEAGDRIDLSYFDCFNWNRSSGAYTARDCSCGNYRVIMFSKDSTSAQNWIFQMQFLTGTLDSGHLNYRKFRLLGAHVGWNIAGGYMIEYPAWDTADLQPCQLPWIYSADDDNLLIDGAVKTDARRWG